MNKLLKVLVIHPQIQYSHRLVFALQQKKYLTKFITSFWYKAKKNRFIYNVLFTLKPEIKKTVSKRYFDFIDEENVQTFPYFELFRKITSLLFKARSLQILALTDSKFDSFASNQIQKLNPDFIIAYENAALFSFQKAKSLNKITILDLAQVHFKEIKYLREKYSYFKESIKNDILFDQVNSRKQAEIGFTDYFFCVSEYAKKTLVNNGIENDNIYVNEVGFDISKFLPKNEYNREKGLNILFTGTITRRKGIHLIIEAFDQLNIKNSNLTIIGPMGDAEDLLRIENPNFIYIPFLTHDELVKYYQKADVFLFPSYLDSFAMVVLEAMACGTPVIVSENTGSKCAVEKGGGFIIPVDDVEAIKEKILYFYNNKEQLEIYGRRAAEIAKDYTWEKYYEKVQNSVMDIARREKLNVLL